MADRLELTAMQDGEPAALRVGLPDRIAKLVGRLEPQARAELEARLPLAVAQLFESMVAVRSLSDEDLAARLNAARADIARYQAETARRAST